jgi:hypothetical protein
MKIFFITIFTHFLLFPVEGFSLSYDWRYGLEGVVTRCFNTRKVKFHCEDFSDPEREKKLVEELQVDAIDFWGNGFSYAYGEGISGTLCQEHFSKIRTLLKGTKQVCITGEQEKVPSGEKITIAKWRALETRKGKVER